MNAHPILDELQRHQVTLERRGDRLRMHAPAPPPSELLARLRMAKAELLTLLPDAAARPVVRFRLRDHASNAWATCLGRSGQSLTDLIGELRERWPGAEVQP